MTDAPVLNGAAILERAYIGHAVCDQDQWAVHDPGHMITGVKSPIHMAAWNDMAMLIVGLKDVTAKEAWALAEHLIARYGKNISDEGGFSFDHDPTSANERKNASLAFGVSVPDAPPGTVNQALQDALEKMRAIGRKIGDKELFLPSATPLPVIARAARPTFRQNAANRVRAWFGARFGSGG